MGRFFFKKDNFFDTQNTQISGALLAKQIVYNRKKITFVLSFGFGFNMINFENIENNFGFKLTANIVDQNAIYSIDKKNLSSSLKQSREQMGNRSKINDYNIDIESEIIRGMVGKSTDEYLTGIVTGKDSFHISTITDIDVADSFLYKCYESYLSNEYKNKFEWIDNVSEIKDKQLIKRLDEQLCKRINCEFDENTKIWTAVPEIIDWEDMDFFYFTGSCTNVYDDISLKIFIDLKKTSEETISIDTLKKNRVVLVSASSGIEKKSWSLYSCIYAEVQLDDKIFVLSNSKWYLLEKDFQKKICDYFNKLIKLRTLPSCSRKYKENYYNKMTANKRKYIHCDAKSIFYGGGKSQIELCDFFNYENKKFFHIKKYGSSAVFSHLFNQGLVSAEAYKDKEFIKVAQERLGIDLPEWHYKEYTVVYGIITNNPENFDLPFFTKVLLKRTEKLLQQYGYNMELEVISCLG